MTCSEAPRFDGAAQPWQPQRWFAWRPVRTVRGDWRWLREVETIIATDERLYLDKSTLTWAYRDIGDGDFGPFDPMTTIGGRSETLADFIRRYGYDDGLERFCGYACYPGMDE